MVQRAMGKPEQAQPTKPATVQRAEAQPTNCSLRNPVAKRMIENSINRNASLQNLTHTQLRTIAGSEVQRESSKLSAQAEHPGVMPGYQQAIAMARGEAAAAQEENGPESNLAARLLSLWAAGSMSAAAVQQLARRT